MAGGPVRKGWGVPKYLGFFLGGIMERKPVGKRDVRDGLGGEARTEPEAPGGHGGDLSPKAEFSALSVRFLDAVAGPRHDQFAAEAGISPARASLYRYGRTVPRPATMLDLTRKMRLPLAWVEAVTADALSFRGRSQAPAGSEPLDAVADNLSRRLAGRLAPRLAAIRGEAAPPPPLQPSLDRAAADRTEATERWAEIELLTEAERSILVLEISSFRTWAFVERLCRKSAEAESTAEALALAKLAVRLSRRVAASPGFRDRISGFALLHSARAYERAGDPFRAREARARGMRLFAEGRREDPGLLDEGIDGTPS